eukprot:TRINITY_DN29926_c0_g1_i2.p1 TRINITY_DN29926_c0_g1~~TRINITY_DN29926_c0_g1_i2.p1  ORF type:complete len:238 (+),score=37.09 TRINITY_DN29926_c0_g1_i2:103-816(+)
MATAAPARQKSPPKRTGDFPPCDQLQYARYLDKMAKQRCAPRWTFGRSESDSALMVKTAADRYQPGQYKIDRDFVSDGGKEVRKDVDARFKRVRRPVFGTNARYDSDGILKGIRNPGDTKLWINKVGPGQYEELDTLPTIHRRNWPSAPAWTQRKGEGQETVRAHKCASLTPGPGHYQAHPTKLETLAQQRHHKVSSVNPLQKKVTAQSAGQFAVIFNRLGQTAAGRAANRMPTVII